MLGREAKVPANFTSRISKEGVDFVNKVKQNLFRCYKEQLERDWDTTASAKY